MTSLIREAYEFKVVSKQSDDSCTQVVACSTDNENPSTLVINYGLSDSQVLDYVGQIWKVTIE